MLKLAFANEFLYIVAAGMVKLAILTFYQRFTLTGTSRLFRYVVWFSIGFITLHTIAFSVESFANCRPFNQSFDVDMVQTAYQTCANTRTVADIRGVLSVVEDFAVVLLGGWLAIKSTASGSQKMIMLGVGMLVCLAGVFRFGYFWMVYANNSDWSCKSNFSYTTVTFVDAGLMTVQGTVVSPSCGQQLSAWPAW